MVSYRRRSSSGRSAMRRCASAIASISLRAFGSATAHILQNFLRTLASVDLAQLLGERRRQIQVVDLVQQDAGLEPPVRFSVHRRLEAGQEFARAEFCDD